MPSEKLPVLADDIKFFIMVKLKLYLKNWIRAPNDQMNLANDK